jgi:hypothetical protein
MRKLPKSLNIGGVTWSIKVNKEVNGGSFSWHDHTINIGKLTLDRQFNTLIHEVCEIIMVNHTSRYQKCLCEVDNGDYMFIMDHNLFSIFADELSGILKEIKSC